MAATLMNFYDDDYADIYCNRTDDYHTIEASKTELSKASTLITITRTINPQGIL